MVLADWLKDRGWTNREFALAIADTTGVEMTPECVRLYRAGLRRPERPRITAIIRLTEGQVNVDDFEFAYQNRKRKGRRR